MSSAATAGGGESLTVHELIRRLAPDYLKAFGASMPARQREAEP